ncbi:MAG: hypothetical protein WA373_00475 [Burkholderiales bacterium]
MSVQQIRNMYDPLLLLKLALSNQLAAFARGVFSFTVAAKLTLRIIWLLPRITLAELICQAFEFQQIRHTEKRTILAYDDLRIGSNEIRPLRRNRADRGIIDPDQEASSVTVVSLANASDLPPAERMEWMRDAHKTHPWDRSTCTLG